MNPVDAGAVSDDFSGERNGFVYGFVRGTSMWPAFIGGDVLRAERIRTSEIRVGDVLVLQREALPPRVHRLISVEPGADGLLLRTAGDRSGSDEPVMVPPGSEQLRVAGVLRKGRWRSIPARSPLAAILPGVIVRLHSRLVRGLAWPIRRIRGVDRLPSDEQ